MLRKHCKMERALEFAGEFDKLTIEAIDLKTIQNANNNNDNNNVLVHPNCEPFNCPICQQHFEIDEGVILTGCLHEFCRKCIVRKIHQHHAAANVIRVNCPFDNGYKCESFLSEDEIVDLVTRDIDFINNNPVTGKQIMEMDEIIVLSDSDDSFESVDSEPWNTATQSRIIDCPRCFRSFSEENGIILKICKHSVCKECIIDHFFKNRKHQMKCEFKIDNGSVCGNNISENEIRSVLNEVGLNDADETIVGI